MSHRLREKRRVVTGLMLIRLSTALIQLLPTPLIRWLIRRRSGLPEVLTRKRGNRLRKSKVPELADCKSSARKVGKAEEKEKEEEEEEEEEEQEAEKVGELGLSTGKRELR